MVTGDSRWHVVHPSAHAHEQEALELYTTLLGIVVDRDVMLEEYARRMIAEETMHKSEVDKMLRHPGDVGTFAM